MEDPLPGSFHVHIWESPYCISFTYHLEKDKERCEQAALDSAYREKGVLLGPFEFDYVKCKHREFMETEAHEKDFIPTKTTDLPLPVLRKDKDVTPGRQSWHIHLNKKPFCISFSTDIGGFSPEVAKKKAEVYVQHLRERYKDEGGFEAEVFGPVDFSNGECQAQVTLSLLARARTSNK